MGQLNSTSLKAGALVLAVMFFAGGMAPAAAAEPGQWNFELYAGWYFAGDVEDISQLPGTIPETLEALGVEPGDDLTWGLRVGRRQTEKWGWQVSGGIFDVDDSGEILELFPKLSLELFLIDISFLYYVGEGNFFVYGGPGFATVDLDVQAAAVGPIRRLEIDESETSFSIHAGLGYNFDIGRNAFIRMDSRFRYIDADVYSGETDIDLTVAIGWNFGG